MKILGSTTCPEFLKGATVQPYVRTVFVFIRTFDMNLEGKKVTIHDMCLRDGMHPKRHQITVDEMITVAKAMDDAGMPMIEVTHGDGLGGRSVNYGFPAASDEEYLRAVCGVVKNTKQ